MIKIKSMNVTEAMSSSYVPEANQPVLVRGGGAQVTMII